MSSPKNIDRLFQEKLQHFEQQPRHEVWSQIQNRMHKKKKRRMVAWWWYSGVAVVLISLFLLLPKDSSRENIIMDDVITESPDIVDVIDTIKKKNPKETLPNPTVLENSETLLTETKKEEKTQTEYPQNTPRKLVIPEVVIAENKSAQKNADTAKIPNLTDTDKKEKTISDTQNTVSIAAANLNKKSKEKILDKPMVDIPKKVDSLREKSITKKKKKLYALKEDETKENEKKGSNWSLRSLVAVSSMLGTSASSPTDQVFRDNPTSGNAAFNYGISVSYQVNKKLSFQTGIFTQNVDFDTERVTLSLSSIGDNNFTNIASSENLPFVLSGFNGDTQALSDLTSNGNIVETNAVLNQTISYIEIPFEVTYRIVQSKKLNTSFIGGFSSLFLNENDIILQSNIAGTSSIGTANNLNSVNFSGNIGLGLDYQIHKKIFFNINPMIKVHLNTFSRDQNGYLPVFLGMYLGLKYKF